MVSACGRKNRPRRRRDRQKAGRVKLHLGFAIHRSRINRGLCAPCEIPRVWEVEISSAPR